MYGLNLAQETALTICYSHQTSGGEELTELGIPDAFLELKNMGMIRMITDMSGNLVFFQGLEPLGADHYDKARRARRRFRAVDDSADELMMRLALEDQQLKAQGKGRLISTDLGAVQDYYDLSRAGLLTVKTADDRPYIVTVTPDGRSYAEGWFEAGMDAGTKIVNNNNPTFINNVGGSSSTSEASAHSEANADVSLAATISSIFDLDIDDRTKLEVQKELADLDKASEEKDKAGFAEKLEKVASIAKSSASLAGVVLPFAQMAIGKLLGQ